MSYIKLLKTLPDNRTVEYYKIAEVIFDTEPNIMLIKLSSYASLEQIKSQIPPEATLLVPVEYTGTYQEALTDILQKVKLNPEWSSAEIINGTN